MVWRVQPQNSVNIFYRHHGYAADFNFSQKTLADSDFGFAVVFIFNDGTRRNQLDALRHLASHRAGNLFSLRVSKFKTSPTRASRSSVIIVNP